MTIAGSPTPRSTTTKPARPRPGSWPEPWPGTRPVAHRLRPARDHGEEDPALPAPDQRQDRTLPPHHGRRLGLRPPLHLRDPTTRRPGRLAPRIQSPPAPLSHRRQTPDQPIDQRPRSVHLALDLVQLGGRGVGGADVGAEG